jgi:hypothetical protein
LTHTLSLYLSLSLSLSFSLLVCLLVQINQSLDDTVHPHPIPQSFLLSPFDPQFVVLDEEHVSKEAYLKISKFKPLMLIPRSGRDRPRHLCFPCGRLWACTRRKKLKSLHGRSAGGPLISHTLSPRFPTAVFSLSLALLTSPPSVHTTIPQSHFSTPSSPLSSPLLIPSFCRRYSVLPFLFPAQRRSKMVALWMRWMGWALSVGGHKKKRSSDSFDDATTT